MTLAAISAAAGCHIHGARFLFGWLARPAGLEPTTFRSAT